MVTSTERLTGLIANLVSLSVIYLPDDALARLTELKAAEQQETNQRIYDAMFANIEMAQKLNRPCCQDTGLLQFFVQAGTSFPYLAELKECIKRAVIQATASTPLRPNVVECFSEQNTGDNTGTNIPWIDWDIIPHKDWVRIYVYPAGGGCSLPGFARVFMPLDGYQAAIKAIFDQIIEYGINACPPLLVGIGFAGNADTAAKLSKKALLRGIGEPNPDPKAAELEQELKTAMDSIGIGPGGFMGNSSLMAVHVEHAGRHIASLAAALSLSCWVHRRSLIEIQSDLSYQVLSHKRLGDGILESIK